jgi:hypothetical protein
MFYDSVEAMAKDAPNVAKRLFSAANIAYNAVNAGTLSAKTQGFENGSGIAVADVGTEEFVSARGQQAKAAQEVLASAVYGILDGAAAAARGGPPGMAQATQAAAKEQVNNMVKRHKEEQEARATAIAEVKYKKELDKAATDIERRLFAATAASTKPISDEVQKSIDDASVNLYVTRPKDPMINTVA